MSEQPSWWTPQLRTRVVDLLEADGDPHLQRVDDRSLTLRSWEQGADDALVLTVTFARLTYGGCGAPAGCVSETARLRGRLVAGEITGLS
jgi:hypothetical protein